MALVSPYSIRLKFILDNLRFANTIFLASPRLRLLLPYQDRNAYDGLSYPRDHLIEIVVSEAIFQVWCKFTAYSLSDLK